MGWPKLMLKGALSKVKGECQVVTGLGGHGLSHRRLGVAAVNAAH